MQVPECAGSPQEQACCLLHLTSLVHQFLESNQGLVSVCVPAQCSQCPDVDISVVFTLVHRTDAL